MNAGLTFSWRSAAIAVTAALLLTTASAQETTQPPVNAQLPVNWLYGAYVPKDVPLVPLTGPERFKLYVRQTYTTPGIYIKTGFFAIHDQVRDTPADWGDGFSGFAKRVGSNHATNIMQNSFTSLGQASRRHGSRATTVAAAQAGGAGFVTPSSETSSRMTAAKNP